MFLLQQVLRTAPGRQTEAVKRLRWIHTQMAEHPGSAGTIVAKFLGNPIDLLILRMWKDQAAYTDFMRGPGGQFPRSKPSGIYDSLDVGHNWEEALGTDGNAEGGFILRSGFKVQPDRWEDFLKHRKEIDTLAGWYGGLVRVQTFRNLDNGEEALVLMRLRDREAMEELVVSPSKVALDSKAQESAAELFSECLAIVDEFVR